MSVGSPWPHWPTLPVKCILPVRGTTDFYLKSRETSENLVSTAPMRDGHLTYQFYYNQGAKLTGYKFSLETFERQGELFPRTHVFPSNIMASYVPVDKVQGNDGGTFHVIYHDLSVRLIRYTDPAGYLTYCLLMRAKHEV